MQLSVEYPNRALNRLTTAFRLIVAIPILIVAASVGGNAGTYGSAGRHAWMTGAGAGGLLFLAPLLMIVFRQKYPRWLVRLEPSSCSDSRTGSASTSL